MEEIRVIYLSALSASPLTIGCLTRFKWACIENFWWSSCLKILREEDQWSKMLESFFPINKLWNSNMFFFVFSLINLFILFSCFWEKYTLKIIMIQSAFLVCFQGRFFRSTTCRKQRESWWNVRCENNRQKSLERKRRFTWKWNSSITQVKLSAPLYFSSLRCTYFCYFQYILALRGFKMAHWVELTLKWSMKIANFEMWREI